MEENKFDVTIDADDEAAVTRSALALYTALIENECPKGQAKFTNDAGQTVIVTIEVHND